MKKTLQKLFRKTGLQTYTLKYYSADVEASWTFDDEGVADGTLQAVYHRKYTINDAERVEDYWLYLTPEDAAAVGAVLVAWAASHGERA